MVFPKVLCSLTTFSPKGFSWQAKLEEIRALRLNEFALFLTGLKDRERYELYRELLILKQEINFEIPFVHATSEMTDDDYLFLEENFAVKAFNLHPTRYYPLAFPLSERSRSKIFIENATLTGGGLAPEDLKGFAGICFDLSHCEDERSKDPNSYGTFSSLTNKAIVGANHISSVPVINESRKRIHAQSQHYFSDLQAFNYIESYSPEFFGDYCAIELEDPIHTQLKVKEYVEDIIRMNLMGEDVKKVA